jgi:hypothetical protein
MVSTCCDMLSWGGGGEGAAQGADKHHSQADAAYWRADRTMGVVLLALKLSVNRSSLSNTP